MIGKGEPNEESSNGDKEEDVKKLITMFSTQIQLVLLFLFLK